MKSACLYHSRKILELPIGAIRPNPNQPRREFAEGSLTELRDSIRQYGILQPLSVRKLSSGSFELIAGERRLRAAAMADLRTVPCILLSVDDRDSGLLALVENLQRKDLDFVEEAEGLNRLIRNYRLTQEDAARYIGKSQSAIANKLRILRLPAEALRALRDGGFTERHARALLRLEDPALLEAALCRVTQERLTVAETEACVDALLSPPAPLPEKGRRKPPVVVLKDVRIFLNTLTRGLNLMKRGGVNAVVDRQETEGDLLLTIRIPKAVQAGQLTPPPAAL